MRNTFLSVGLVVIGIAVGALSARASQGYTVYGAGTFSCGRWLTEKADPDDVSFKLSWVLGYVSASGYLQDPKQPLRKTDGAGMKVWIEQYCTQNPLKDMNDAAQALVEDLKKK